MARKGLNIYRRKDGRWEGRYKSGFTADGKTKYCSVYGKSYSAVREQIETKRAEYRSGAECSCKSTVGEIIDMWLEDVKNKVKASTLANYEMKLNKHILPYFSGIRYEKLTADDLNVFISHKTEERLSAKYIADIVVLLKSAARFAQKRYGYVNRIDSVTLPKSDKKPDNRLLSDTDQSKLKAALTSDPICSNVGILLSDSFTVRRRIYAVMIFIRFYLQILISKISSYVTRKICFIRIISSG